MVVIFCRHTLLKSTGTTFTMTQLNLLWLILEVVLLFSAYNVFLMSIYKNCFLHAHLVILKHYRIHFLLKQSLTFDLFMTGNGLFLLEMAKRRKDLNFLGLEMNEKVSYLLLLLPCS